MKPVTCPSGRAAPAVHAGSPRRSRRLDQIDRAAAALANFVLVAGAITIALWVAIPTASTTVWGAMLLTWTPALGGGLAGLSSWNAEAAS